jgi:L-aspartate semialdehyde sulfurtransferase ferredoxin
MSEQNLHLVYPPSLINVPVIYQLIRRFDISVNIIRAYVTEEEGWLDIQVDASPSTIEAALDWLKSQGLKVQIIK